jgi:hypothetical protein
MRIEKAFWLALTLAWGIVFFIGLRQVAIWLGELLGKVFLQ